MKILRQTRGKNFFYTNQHNEKLKDQDKIDFIQSLVIPPAWTNVEITTNRRAKILAIGRDQKGRKQYIYNPKFRAKKDADKFDRILHFAENLEHMRRVTGQHLRKKKMSREKVMAAMVRLLDSAYFRPGSPKYTQQNKSYGLTTIRKKHLTIEGDEIIFSYKGKSGKFQEKHIINSKLSKVIAQLEELPGYRLFKYYDEEEELILVESQDLNQYIKEVMGEEFSAKDFRTWAGTMIAAGILDELGICEKQQQKEMNKRIRNAIVAVSERLGNTPAVARDSYIDPRIFEHYKNGQTIQYFQKEIKKLLKKNENLSETEIGVLYMLKSKMN
ncbi:DNA topoisomerase IB [Epilithonimonas hispanica]|uniref:DNA topoisomerase n=1 Tax=Epilithonimonas hispanica TaxID=358687 RepID=A0A3D9D4B3_9FLAO|nr:DNA topoisomerase IB [Epilithonimonas hispanica]REC72804.1 DNA topoisomerase IB [Epilithonimonas hispanica]